MKNLIYPRVALPLLFLLACPLVQAATINKAEYDAGQVRINAEYKNDKAACSSQAGNAKDICVEEAKGKEKVATAELAYAHSGKSSDMNKIKVAKAEAAYAIAKEKCDDKAGNAKDVCVEEAKAAKTKALADAKLIKEIGASKTDAAEDRRDADYKVAAEKCNSLSGEAKSSCVEAAQSQFGKN